MSTNWPDHAPIPAPDPTRSSLRASSKSTKIRVRWGRVAFTLVLGAVIGGMLTWGFLVVTEPDPAYGGVPACTDAIADAGGICHGEPR